MKTVHKAMAIALATSLGARAEAHGGGHDSGLVLIDILLNLFTLFISASP